MRYPELIDPRMVDAVRNAHIAPRKHLLPSLYAGSACMVVISLAAVALLRIWS